MYKISTFFKNILFYIVLLNGILCCYIDILIIGQDKYGDM